MLKVCNACGRVHKDGEVCKVKRELRKRYDTKHKDSDIRRWRNTKWRKIRDYILYRDSGCLVCRDKNRNQLSEDLSVHHIVSLQEDWSLKDDETNLITLCRDDHDFYEDKTEFRDYLQSLVLKSISDTYEEG